jgi:hypothetical protein
VRGPSEHTPNIVMGYQFAWLILKRKYTEQIKLSLSLGDCLVRLDDQAAADVELVHRSLSKKIGSLSEIHENQLLTLLVTLESLALD